MIDIMVTFCLAWLFVGTTIWAFGDPIASTNKAVRLFLDRHGRLPGSGQLVLANLMVIAAWPLVVAR